ncbi:MAG: hypothetical protein HYY93_05465 [Planctomycetes bacterium]|nr:hypothetical protein [Planctomycetota bacterium]
MKCPQCGTTRPDWVKRCGKCDPPRDAPQAGVSSPARDYRKELSDLFGTGREQAIEQTVAEAFKDPGVPESLLAYCSAITYEARCTNSPTFLRAFIDRYPESAHPIRVYLADVFAYLRDADSATDGARVYLRQAWPTIRDPDFQRITHEPNMRRLIANGVAQALLLTTLAYTEVGARSYSLRVLDRHRELLGHEIWTRVDECWKQAFEREYARLKEELRGWGAGAQDTAWEEFFSKGDRGPELIRVCESRKMKTLANRVELLEAQHRFDPHCKIGASEMFLLVYRSPDGGQVLR